MRRKWPILHIFNAPQSQYGLCCKGVIESRDDAFPDIISETVGGNFDEICCIPGRREAQDAPEALAWWGRDPQNKWGWGSEIWIIQGFSI